MLASRMTSDSGSFQDEELRPQVAFWLTLPLEPGVWMRRVQ